MAYLEGGLEASKDFLVFCSAIGGGRRHGGGFGEGRKLAPQLISLLHGARLCVRTARITPGSTPGLLLCKRTAALAVLDEQRTCLTASSVSNSAVNKPC